MTVARHAAAWRLLAAANLAAILYATLSPAPERANAAAATPLLCLACGPRGGTDLFLNLLMMAPLAACLRLGGWSWRRVALGCALLSLGIELLQLSAIPGRDASLSDLLSNSTGAAAGAAIAPHLKAILTPGRRMARRLTLGGAILWLALSLLSAWLLTPWRGTPAVMSEWSGTETADDAYRGRLERVVVSGESPGNWLLGRAESDRIRRLFSGETIEMRLEVVSDEPKEYESWIYRLWAGAAIARVSQNGRAILLEVPRRSARLKLSGPRLRVDNAAPAKGGIPFEIRAGESGPRLWVEAIVEGRTRRADLSLEPMMAWGLAAPLGYAFGPEAGLLTMLWVGALVLPLAYWSAHGFRPPTAVLLVILAIAGGLGIMPWLAGAGPVPPRDWIAAAAGAAAGWAARARATYLASRCGSPSTSESFSS